MKLNLKPLSIVGLLVLASSCKSADIVSTKIENIDKTPLKVQPLTEEENQRWAHMDLVQDTVPGMSVERAYKEIIKKRKGKKVIVAVIDSRHIPRYGQVTDAAALALPLAGVPPSCRFRPSTKMK